MFFFSFFNTFKDISEIYFLPTEVSPLFFVCFTNAFFCLSLFGFVSNLNHLLFSLIYLEIMLLSIASNFIYFSLYMEDPRGQIFALLLLGVAVCEAALGLSLLVVSSRVKTAVVSVNFNTLKG